MRSRTEQLAKGLNVTCEEYCATELQYGSIDDIGQDRRDGDVRSLIHGLLRVKWPNWRKPILGGKATPVKNLTFPHFPHLLCEQASL